MWDGAKDLYFDCGILPGLETTDENEVQWEPGLISLWKLIDCYKQDIIIVIMMMMKKIILIILKITIFVTGHC